LHAGATGINAEFGSGEAVVESPLPIHRLLGFFICQFLARMPAFRGYLAQAYVLKLRPDKPGRHNGQKGHGHVFRPFRMKCPVFRSMSNPSGLLISRLVQEQAFFRKLFSRAANRIESIGLQPFQNALIAIELVRRFLKRLADVRSFHGSEESNQASQ
jgi:hypothetical protein